MKTHKNAKRIPPMERLNYNWQKVHLLTGKKYTF